MPQGEQEALIAEFMRKKGITRDGLRGSHRRRSFRGLIAPRYPTLAPSATPPASERAKAF